MKRLFRTLLAFSFAVVPLIARADAADDALAAYRSGDYAKALQLWRAQADQGDATAQFRLGSMYAEGKGVARDDKLALSWFLKAAEQGDAMAQYDAAVSYVSGIGVDPDFVAAAKWFRRAADQGMAYAQLNLGLLYAAGHGVPQDNVEAMTWLQLALFALPAGGARSDAAHAMEDISTKMTPEQREDAREHARTWKAKPEKK